MQETKRRMVGTLGKIYCRNCNIPSCSCVAGCKGKKRTTASVVKCEARMIALSDWRTAGPAKWSSQMVEMEWRLFRTFAAFLFSASLPSHLQPQNTIPLSNRALPTKTLNNLWTKRHNETELQQPFLPAGERILVSRLLDSIPDQRGTIAGVACLFPRAVLGPRELNLSRK